MYPRLYNVYWKLRFIFLWSNIACCLVYWLQQIVSPCLFIVYWRKTEKQFKSEYLFVNQMSIGQWNLSENWKVLNIKILLCFNLKTRNIRSLFNLKDKTSHISSVMYEENCNCGEYYIGGIGQNVTLRWSLWHR